jgi:hypothetical protein
MAESNALLSGHSDVRANSVGVFTTMQNTASCWTNVTEPGLLYAALQELGYVNTCFIEYAVLVGACIVSEYACFVDEDCRHCLSAVYAANDNESTNSTKAAAFRSRACSTVSSTQLANLMSNCAGAFPECTLSKHQCTSLPSCASCLATLGSADGSKAARQCAGTTSSALALDAVVGNCVDKDAVACDYFLQRCADNSDCSACLAGMGNDNNARANAEGMSTPPCQRALQDGNAIQYLSAISSSCSGVSRCRNVVVACFLEFGEVCTPCVDGTASVADQASNCTLLSEQYAFDSACQPCSASVHTTNVIVCATATVGAASAVACLAVVTTLVAHGRDRAMRDRIVIGLIVVNTMYSTANVIPIHALRTDELDCGRMAMSFDTIRFGRAWWFCGKYGLVSFELFILGASIRALLRGLSAVSVCAETVMHVACCAVAGLAFAVFYVLCSRINADGYNESVENEVYTTRSITRAPPTTGTTTDLPSLLR